MNNFYIFVIVTITPFILWVGYGCYRLFALDKEIERINKEIEDIENSL